MPSFRLNNGVQQPKRINAMKSKQVFVTVGALAAVFAFSGCSAAEMIETQVKAKAACVFVSTPYDGWVSAGSSSGSVTGKLGQEATLAGLDAALGQLSGLASAEEIELAKSSLTSKTSGFSAAELAAAITNFSDSITIESKNGTDWTPGQMPSVDSGYATVQSVCSSIAS